MRRFMCAFALALVLVAPSSAGADDPFVGEPPQCGDPTVASLSVLDCDPVEAVPSLDASMPQTTEAVAEFRPLPASSSSSRRTAGCRRTSSSTRRRTGFGSARRWRQMPHRVPSTTSRSRHSRPTRPSFAPPSARADQGAGPRFHAMAEIHFSGWSTWVAANPARTWCAAGSRGTAQDGGQELPRRARGHLVDQRVQLGRPPRRRQRTAERPELRPLPVRRRRRLLPPSAGNVFIVGIGQGTVLMTVYKSVLREWLAVTPFWNDMARSVRWWGQEVYGSPQFTMVPDTSRNERSRSLSDYLYAVANLAESGPEEISTARDSFRARRTTRWPARPGATRPGSASRTRPSRRCSSSSRSRSTRFGTPSEAGRRPRRPSWGMPGHPATCPRSRLRSSTPKRWRSRSGSPRRSASASLRAAVRLRAHAARLVSTSGAAGPGRARCSTPSGPC